MPPKPATPPAVRLIAWAEPGQSPLLREAVEDGTLALTAVGSPDPTDGTLLSEDLSAERADTLRDAILRDDADILWIASPQPIDKDERRLLREATPAAVSSEPLPASAAEVFGDPDEARTAHFVPLMRQSPGYEAAADVFETFGDRHAANIMLGCGPGQGTLFARLFDAMDLAEAIGGTVEHVHAALWRPLGGVPETLRSLTGTLTINLRFRDNRCASLCVSDTAGGWLRRVVVVGTGGCLRIDDGGFEWIGPDGRTVDAHREKRDPSPGELVARQVRRLLEGRAQITPSPDPARLLALCEAARLSARTGGIETPDKVIEMLKRP
jgi:hypothetical protein